MRQDLESKLLFAAPAELLLAEPASPETKRLMQHIGEQLGTAPRLEAAPADKYRREGAALAALEALYGSSAEDGGGGASTSGAAAEGAAAPAAALQAVRRLPPLVLRALAHLLDFLRPFGLAGALRLGASFQEWHVAQEMRLSSNTLRHARGWGPGLAGTA